MRSNQSNRGRRGRRNHYHNNHGRQPNDGQPPVDTGEYLQLGSRQDTGAGQVPGLNQLPAQQLLFTGRAPININYHMGGNQNPHGTVAPAPLAQVAPMAPPPVPHSAQYSAPSRGGDPQRTDSRWGGPNTRRTDARSSYAGLSAGSSANETPLGPRRQPQLLETGYAETITDSNAMSRTSAGSRKRQRGADMSQDTNKNLTKKQKTVHLVQKGNRKNCAVCNAEDHRAASHPYPNTKWGYLLCCVIHNTLDHSTADCRDFQGMSDLRKWMCIVDQRSNMAPVYAGHYNAAVLMTSSNMTAGHLPGGCGPWSPEFSLQSVNMREDIRKQDFYKAQRNGEGRGFHNLETQKGRQALRDSKVWASTQFWDPTVRHTQYDHINWPQPTNQEVQRELAHLNQLAMDGKHYAPCPNWRTEPGLDVEMGNNTQVEIPPGEQHGTEPQHSMMRDAAESLPDHARQALARQVLAGTGEVSMDDIEQKAAEKNTQNGRLQGFSRPLLVRRKPLGKARAHIPHRVSPWMQDMDNSLTLWQNIKDKADKDMAMSFRIHLDSNGVERPCAHCGKLHNGQDEIAVEECELYRCLCSDTPGHLAQDCPIACKACTDEADVNSFKVATAMRCELHCGMCAVPNRLGKDGHDNCRLRLADPDRRPTAVEKVMLSAIQVKQCRECHDRHLTQNCPMKICLMGSCDNGDGCEDHCQNCGWVAHHALPVPLGPEIKNVTIQPGDYESMHKSRCHEWTHTKSFRDGKLHYNLLCTKNNTHAECNPVSLQWLRLLWLRKILYNNNCAALCSPGYAVNDDIKPDRKDWSLLPECEECWNVLYVADRRNYFQLEPGKALRRSSMASPDPSEAPTVHPRDHH